MAVNETIGKITLDLKHYPGEDLYSDGASEQELLDIVSAHDESDFKDVIDEKMSWPVLYHLSDQRENIVSWLPIKKSDRVLEVGSGCGAITGVFSKKAGSVDCVDLSKRRSTINALRHKECDNVTIHVGNFLDIEPDLPAYYDWVCLIGVFEYGSSYMSTEKPYHKFLETLKKHVAPGGRIVIAIENRLGLKYFAGCSEDHLGTYFSGIEGYKSGDYVRTFSRPGLEKIFKECGEDEYHFYYPYPDYKFPITIYSDKRLPLCGELTNNIRNFDRDRLLLFDEKNAFDSVISDDLFPLFSNSYLVILGDGISPVYARFSNERSDDRSIVTSMEQDNNDIVVKKIPMTKEAESHIKSLTENYKKLSEKYAGSALKICECTLTENAAVFPFVKGRSLNDILDECIKSGDMNRFNDIVSDFKERISFNGEYPFTDFDLVFSNVIADGDDWTVIDYEWTKDEPTDSKYQTWRALYCYMLESDSRSATDLHKIYDILDITAKDEDEYIRREMAFHETVQSGHMSLAQFRARIGTMVIHPEKYIDMNGAMENARRVQVYTDKGNGYSEEESRFIKDAVFDDERISFKVRFSGDVKNLRVDPMMSAGAVFVETLKINGSDLPDRSKKYLECNGRKLRGDKEGYIFETNDPNMNIHLETIELNKDKDNELEAVFTYAAMSEDAAHGILTAAKRII